MRTLAWLCAIPAGIIAMTFLPFAPGGYDALAAPLGATAWVLGRAGLLIVPIGLLWLWPLARDQAARSPWLVRLSVGTAGLVLATTSVAAFAASGSLLLGGLVLIIAVLSLVRLTRALRRHPAAPVPRAVPALLALAPLVVLAVQLTCLERVAAHARDRAIANAAPLIDDIERYRERHGVYPESILAIWGDYKPSIVGVERYVYERTGDDGYTVMFREPSLAFGTRQFVAYNPRDRQRVTVHEADRLRLDEAGLDADNAGHTVVRTLAQPHWKFFLFLS